MILNQGYTAQIVLTIFHSKNLTRFKLGAALFSVDNFPEIFLYLFFSLPSALSVLFPPSTRIITLPTSFFSSRFERRNETRVRRAIAFARPPKGAANWSPPNFPRDVESANNPVTQVRRIGEATRRFLRITSFLRLIGNSGFISGFLKMKKRGEKEKIVDRLRLWSQRHK